MSIQNIRNHDLRLFNTAEDRVVCLRKRRMQKLKLELEAQNKKLDQLHETLLSLESHLLSIIGHENKYSKTN